ncbi:hypothetical protein ACLKA7_000987 [Drosophila subpalustris]
MCSMQNIGNEILWDPKLPGLCFLLLVAASMLAASSVASVRGADEVLTGLVQLNIKAARKRGVEPASTW